MFALMWTCLITSVFRVRVSLHVVIYRVLTALSKFHSFLTVIHFHASWAAQCTQMNDVMTELAKDNTHVKFYKVNVTLIYSPLTLRTSYGKIICLPNFLICGRNPVLIIIQNVKRLWQNLYVIPLIYVWGFLYHKIFVMFVNFLSVSVSLAAIWSEGANYY